MKILVVGAGAVGQAAARQLVLQGHEVTIIDYDPDAIKVSRVPDAEWVLADACSPTQLEEAGAREAHAVAALTGDDKANLVVSLLSKSEFGVPQVIARANRTENEWMYNESWGVDVLASTPQAISAIVEEAVSVGEAVHLLALDSASASVYKLQVPKASKQLGVPPTQLRLPKPLILACVVRGEDLSRPEEVEGLQVGDELIVVAPRQSETRLARLEDLLSV